MMLATSKDSEHVFGPVPSRRLGRSLGINNIRPKVCSYSCAYCQLKVTTDKSIRRQIFYPPTELFDEVVAKVHDAYLKNERIDYLTFVSNGEPTLDYYLANELSLLKRLGIPIAAITNSSLLWREDVARDLLNVNYVSLKLDTVNESLWRRINRPHHDLKLSKILRGIQDFADVFKGTIVTETMLLEKVDYKNEFKALAEFLAGLKKLNRAYIAVPTRPPAENWVRPPKEDLVNSAFQIFSEKLGVDRVECLIGYEGNTFACTGNFEQDLLAIMAVHPMRQEAVREFLSRVNASWAVIDRLLISDKIVELEFEGNRFYMRKFKSGGLSK